MAFISADSTGLPEYLGEIQDEGTALSVGGAGGDLGGGGGDGGDGGDTQEQEQEQTQTQEQPETARVRVPERNPVPVNVTQPGMLPLPGQQPEQGPAWQPSPVENPSPLAPEKNPHWDKSGSVQVLSSVPRVTGATTPQLKVPTAKTTGVQRPAGTSTPSLDMLDIPSGYRQTTGSLADAINADKRSEKEKAYDAYRANKTPENYAAIRGYEQEKTRQAMDDLYNSPVQKLVRSKPVQELRTVNELIAGGAFMYGQSLPMPESNFSLGDVKLPKLPQATSPFSFGH